MIERMHRTVPNINLFLSYVTDCILFCSSDDFTQMVADYLRENPWIFYVGIGSFVIGLIIAFLNKRKSRASSKTKSESKSSSKEASKKSK